jgi:hypothetical protein
LETRLPGFLVGNGPAVSEGVTEQLEAELPLVEPSVVPVDSSPPRGSFEQEITRGARTIIPRLFLINSFLRIGVFIY